MFWKPHIKNAIYPCNIFLFLWDADKNVSAGALYRGNNSNYTIYTIYYITICKSWWKVLFVSNAKIPAKRVHPGTF